MDVIAPGSAAALANTILVLHVGIVAFVVLGQVLILIGARRGWRWIRNRMLRVAHLALMVFIALQSWLGALCPLTQWEQALRRHAGQDPYAVSFIEYWLSRLIFFEAEWWVFVAAYTVFALLVLLTWRWVPPRRSGGAARVGPLH